MIRYVEVTEPLDTEYSTYKIAFCPDTDSFFVTNQRYFFWEHDKEFETEEDGVKYFETNVNEFCNISEKIMNQSMFPNHNWGDKVFLENTGKWYRRIP